MASTHYWDVTSCRWRPCHEEGAGAPPPASLETGPCRPQHRDDGRDTHVSRP